MVIYILQSLILPKRFFFPPEDCSKDQHSFKTTQHIPEETLQETTLQQKPALAACEYGAATAP